jgi:hypothetical protein
MQPSSEVCLLCKLAAPSHVLVFLCDMQKQRSHQKHDFFRKTKRGQPVMKYRVDKILAQLQQEKAAGR